jgi:hypothetical protein
MRLLSQLWLLLLLLSKRERKGRGKSSVCGPKNQHAQ